MFRRVAFVIAALFLVIVSLLALNHFGPWHLLRSTTRESSVTTKPVSGFYLDMGASASLGFQPTGIIHHNGHRTNHGYANDLLTYEASKNVHLKLRQIGCPGETVQSILGQYKDACYTLPNTQLSIATGFLTSNEKHVGLVTIDLGFNDIRPCMLVAAFEESCANVGVASVKEYLPTILGRLQAAAGPNVHFIGLEYSDPYLADYLDGTEGRLNAAETLSDFNHLNAVLAGAYRAAGIAVADVPKTYKSVDTATYNLKLVGPVPTNVAEACLLTWQCTGTPFGPDDHPNNAGYQFIANAIELQLPRKW